MNDIGKWQMSARPIQWISGLGIVVIVAAGLWFDRIKWLFICEVQWGATAFLLFLPLLATTTNRALLLGAYDICLKDHGRYLGFLLVLAAASIIWTGQAELNLAESRLQETPEASWVLSLFGVLVLLAAVVLNLALTHEVSIGTETSSERKFKWCAIDSRMLQGVVFGLLCFIAGEVIFLLSRRFSLFSHLPSAVIDSVQYLQSSVRRCVPPLFWMGYVGKNGQLETEAGQIALLILLFASFFFYWRLRKVKLPPLCCIALLLLVLVWLLSGFAFFFQAFRIPTLLPVVLWLLVSSLHPKADHFYEVVDQAIQTTPNLRFLEAARDDPGIVVVAAAGGGIQASAWTAKVLAGLDSAVSAGSSNAFRTSLRAVSGVSGGSVGLMYYLAALASGSPSASAAGAAATSSLSEVTDALV
jgi:hypothetical protein